MISKLFSREPDTRIFLATDIHGSETCWRKFLNSGKHYEADVKVLGGDMTGKALIPKVEQRGGAGTPPCSKTAMSSGTRRRSRSSRMPSGGVATTRSAPTRTR
jgi:hypothetical protein